MAGIIFVILFWVVIIALKKGKEVENKGNAGNAGNTPRVPQATTAKPTQTPYWNSAQNRQQETKARLEAKYKTTPKPAKESEILRRAKASVNEDFTENRMDTTAAENTPKNWEAENKQKELERRVAAKLAATEEIETDKQQQYRLLQNVEDLMIKGPNTELAFERDFLAEGMDMLNKIQM